MRISDWSSDVCSSDLLYRYSFNHMGFDAVGKQAIRETQHTDRHVTRLRRPVVPAGCHPHLLGKLIREAMKGECRNEADHALGETLGRLGKAMVSIELRIRKLIEPARQADDLAIL